MSKPKTTRSKRGKIKKTLEEQLQLLSKRPDDARLTPKERDRLFEVALLILTLTAPSQKETEPMTVFLGPLVEDVHKF